MNVKFVTYTYDHFLFLSMKSYVYCLILQQKELVTYIGKFLKYVANACGSWFFLKKVLLHGLEEVK
jgi:hypothetical protein